MTYNKLNIKIDEKLKKRNEFDKTLLSEFATLDSQAILSRKINFSLRPPFIIDVDLIQNSVLFNRYGNKTQVFSFQKNNDISTRAYHVQLVSRIARTIGRALKLNENLIEAIALGHDLGHAPFGHRGETELNKIAQDYGYLFSHNVQSARYLTEMNQPRNSLQTIDGILCHNGEVLEKLLIPNNNKLKNFKSMTNLLQKSYFQKLTPEELTPMTLEGCLVRVCDLIAYIGKDRQDAKKLKICKSDFLQNKLGSDNSQFIYNISVDIIENSYDQNYIKISDDVADAINELKKDNYEKIYKSKKVNDDYLFLKSYFKDLFDYYYNLNELDFEKQISLHLNYNIKNKDYFNNWKDKKHIIIIDFIASMSDNYFLELCKHLKLKCCENPIEIKNYDFSIEEN